MKLKTATRAADDGASATVGSIVARSNAQAPARLSEGSTALPIDFAAAVAGIFALPLSDAEKAEAVRRLLAENRRG